MGSIKDVADAAGVSIATVSRVLANKPYVREELRERVMKAVEAQGYRPNRVARSLRAQQSRTIGLIVSDIRNPFFAALSRAVEDTAYQEGVNVFLCNTDENPEKEAIYLDLMDDENVAGLIFSPTFDFSNRTAAWEPDFPVVIVDRRMKIAGFDQVVLDNAASANRLAAHLIANGYTRIGAIFGSFSSTGIERSAGFEAALKECQLGLEREHLKSVLPNIESGYAAAMRMLSLPNRPEALIAGNNLITAGVLQAVRELGLTVPGGIALAGFDDTLWNTLVEPGMTVIAQPTSEIGVTATQLLLQRIRDPKRPVREVILSGELIVRGSSAARS